MNNNQVIIAGGGIGGIVMALTLHQIGVPCMVIESVRELKPLGVGINIQPNAVRELHDLGISNDDLDKVGLQAKEWALVGLNGTEIYSETRGIDAGYKWPQYAAHRGELHMMLYNKLVERIGQDNIILGTKVVGYTNTANGVEVNLEHASGDNSNISGSILVGADGMHSNVRAQVHPDQPPIHWGGALMWRGTSPAVPIRSGASFVGLGTHKHRLVFYPISPVDPKTGLATCNWIAEVTIDNTDDRDENSWFKPVQIDDFIHHFEDWNYDWLDVPALLRKADLAYENPMIDRDPVTTWQDGNVILIGDAAHPMYPTGSNGASQAIMDARNIGAAFLEHGVNAKAISAFDAQFCEPISKLQLLNRGAGPFGLLNLVDERCGGKFENIDDVIPPQERKDFMAGYKNAAGFAIEKLNGSEPTIASNAKLET